MDKLALGYNMVRTTDIYGITDRRFFYPGHYGHKNKHIRKMLTCKTTVSVDIIQQEHGNRKMIIESRKGGYDYQKAIQILGMKSKLPYLMTTDGVAKSGKSSVWCIRLNMQTGEYAPYSELTRFLGRGNTKNVECYESIERAKAVSRDMTNKAIIQAAKNEKQKTA